ncbi:DUF1206 domain-containing protein [Microbacterium sp. P06]|uniref:DUF1206 domain-containing protein n=1 Tax=Microbacterium sp. P06 TaxID=3366949 RepID=UPI00374505B5
MPSSPRSAANTAQSSSAFRSLARAGFVANGVVHGLLGGLVIAVSFGGDEQTDQGGAFQAIAQAPFGAVLLWACAVALWALGAWRAVEAFLARGASGSDRAKRAVEQGGQAVAFFAVGGIAASVALGGQSQGDQSAQSASGSVLALPGGPLILGAVGAIVVAIGIGFVVKGVRKSFRKKITVPGGSVGSALMGLGVAGYVAKGVALVTVGILVIAAAVTVDPAAAGGLDGAVRALLQTPAGPWLGAAVGVGFVAYGVFTVLRAKYARLEA